MKAVYRRTYKEGYTLTISDLPKPAAGKQEILVKIYATTLNRTDCAIITGKPYIMRLFTGIFKPASPIPGTDFAGVVEEIGANVQGFEVGDRVFGFDDTGLHTMAEYATVPVKKAIAHIPADIHYDEAAASVEGLHYALNFINKVTLHANQTALVNGAAGAIGSMLVQLLKYHNVNVTATCNKQNIDLVKGLGADHVIDYTHTDFTTTNGEYDFIFDAVGKSTFRACKKLLTKRGIYISSELGPYLQNPLLALTTRLFGGKCVIFPFPQNINASIQFVKKLYGEKKFIPIIDRRYQPEDIQSAFAYVSAGRKTGQVIIQFHKN